MGEQIIAAVLERDDRNQVTAIVFNGQRYEPQPDQQEDHGACAHYRETGHLTTVIHRDGTLIGAYCQRCTWSAGDASPLSPRALAQNVPFPSDPELLRPDPALVVSPEGDLKDLRELQEAAAEQYTHLRGVETVPLSPALDVCPNGECPHGIINHDGDGDGPYRCEVYGCYCGRLLGDTGGWRRDMREPGPRRRGLFRRWRS